VARRSECDDLVPAFDEGARLCHGERVMANRSYLTCWHSTIFVDIQCACPRGFKARVQDVEAS